MLPEEILQCRDQRFGIRRALVLVRGIRFLSNNDLGMGFEKIFVVKGNMPDDTQPICNDAEFKSIAEMPIDIHLPDCGGGGMGRHGAVGGFIGIKVDGFIEYGKKLIFIVIKCILATGKKICQRKLPKKAVCMVSCRYNSFLVDG